MPLHSHSASQSTSHIFTLNDSHLSPAHPAHSSDTTLFLSSSSTAALAESQAPPSSSSVGARSHARKRSSKSSTSSSSTSGTLISNNGNRSETHTTSLPKSNGNRSGPNTHTSTTNIAQTLSSRIGSMFSPRSSNYERLEGGMGPSRSSPGRRFAWKKFAIGAVVLVGLVYFFGPRREDLDDYVPCEFSVSSLLG